MRNLSKEMKGTQVKITEKFFFITLIIIMLRADCMLYVNYNDKDNASDLMNVAQLTVLRGRSS